MITEQWKYEEWLKKAKYIFCNKNVLKLYLIETHIQNYNFSNIGHPLCKVQMHLMFAKLKGTNTSNVCKVCMVQLVTCYNQIHGTTSDI